MNDTVSVASGILSIGNNLLNGDNSSIRSVTRNSSAVVAIRTNIANINLFGFANSAVSFGSISLANAGRYTNNTTIVGDSAIAFTSYFVAGRRDSINNRFNVTFGVDGKSGLVYGEAAVTSGNGCTRNNPDYNNTVCTINGDGLIFRSNYEVVGGSTITC